MSGYPGLKIESSMSQPSDTVVSIIGGGRVGLTMGAVCARSGARIGVVTCRNRESARAGVDFVGQGEPFVFDVLAGMSAELSGRLELLSAGLGCHIIIISVRDDLIGLTAQLLASVLAASAHISVLHCSGGLGPDALEAFSARGVPCGVLHPCYPVMKPLLVCPVGVPVLFTYQGDALLGQTCGLFVKSWGAGMLVLPCSLRRKEYHAANVLSTGHVVAMLSRAHLLLRAAGVTDGEAVSIIRSLINGVCENLETSDHANGEKIFRNMATGPFVRGDEGLIAEQRRVVSNVEPMLGELYDILGAVTRDLCK